MLRAIRKCEGVTFSAGRRRWLALGSAVLVGAAPNPPWGHYRGDVITKWNADGRTMTLLFDFEFVDAAETHWQARAPHTIDGASIPKVFWSIIGPYEDKYRNASVIHDYFCDVRTRPWPDVHTMFYHAMRASGVGEITAKIMFAAVYFKGPRWDRLSPPPEIPCRPPEDKTTHCRATRMLEALNNRPENRKVAQSLERQNSRPAVQTITRADVSAMARLRDQIKEANPPLSAIVALVATAAAFSLELQRRDGRGRDVLEYRDLKGLDVPSPAEREAFELRERVERVVRETSRR